MEAGDAQSSTILPLYKSKAFCPAPAKKNSTSAYDAEKDRADHASVYVLFCGACLPESGFVTMVASRTSRVDSLGRVRYWPL